MFSWRAQRKLLYILAVAFFGLCAAVIAGFFLWYEAPNCSDGRKNQDELGIDCGGSCARICTSEVPDIRIDWVRFFKVKNGVFSAAAHAENPNAELSATGEYHFRLYNSAGVVIKEVAGRTYIPPGQTFGIFEGGINVGNQVPARVEFQWDKDPIWERYDGGPKTVYIKEVVRSFDGEGLPRVQAEIYNNNLRPVQNIVGFAAVYGPDGLAVAASRTVVDSIEGGGKGMLVFSWPMKFTNYAGRVEVLHWRVPTGY